MSRRLALTLTIYLVTFAGCMSEQDAAQMQFDQVLNEFGLSEGAGKADAWGIGEKVGQVALCQVLRRFLGDKPEAQKLVLVQGETISYQRKLAGAGVGAELAIDLANYQAAPFTIAQAGVGLHIGTIGVGAYRGLFWGDHTSVLDMHGFRVMAAVRWTVPILPFLDFGFRGFAKFDKKKPGWPTMWGGAFDSKAGLGRFPIKGLAKRAGKSALKMLAPWTFIIPSSFDAGGGYWRPVSKIGAAAGISTAQEIAEMDAEFGAEVNTQCPKAHFVQYHGKPDEKYGYHAQRANAIAQRILADSVDWDPGTAALARIAIGLGIARDHGGFGTVCGTGEAEGEGLDPAPPPTPVCPGDLPPVEETETETEDTEEETELPKVTFVSPKVENLQTTPNTPITVKLEVSNKNFKSIALRSTTPEYKHHKEWTEAPFEMTDLRFKTGTHDLVVIIIDKDDKEHEAAKITVTSKVSDVTSGATGISDAEAKAREAEQARRAAEEEKNKTDPNGVVKSNFDDSGCSLVSDAKDSSSLALLLIALFFARRRRR